MPIHTLRACAIRFFAGAAVALALASPGQAAIMIRTSSFSISGFQALAQFKGFDPSLGKLDSVDVMINGSLGFDVLLPWGQTLTPLVDFGAQGAGGSGFDFLTDGHFILPSAANLGDCGSPNCPPLFIPFGTSISLDFTLTALSDLSGIAAATTSTAGFVTPLITAQRADFIQNIIPIFEALTFVPEGFTPVGGLSGGGGIMLTYHYTPPTPITPTIGSPEPATIALFVLAPGLLLLRRRRAARHSQGAA